MQSRLAKIISGPLVLLLCQVFLEGNGLVKVMFFEIRYFV